jgi:hypothetical protein
MRQRVTRDPALQLDTLLIAQHDLELTPSHGHQFDADDQVPSPHHDGTFGRVY